MSRMYLVRHPSGSTEDLANGVEVTPFNAVESIDFLKDLFGQATGIYWSEHSIKNVIGGGCSMGQYRGWSEDRWTEQNSAVEPDPSDVTAMVLAITSCAQSEANTPDNLTDEDAIVWFTPAESLKRLVVTFNRHFAERGIDEKWAPVSVERLLSGHHEMGCRCWTAEEWDNRKLQREPAPVGEIEEAIISTPVEPTDEKTVMLNERTTIFIVTRREFIHNFPGAATIPELCAGDDMDVSFLASPHRHEWGFRVEMEVFHDNRDAEFIQVKRTLERYLDELPVDLGSLSCEQFAKAIITRMTQKWGVRYWKVEVNEDQENGAIVESYPVLDRG